MTMATRRKIPVLDLDRQSFFVRLEGKECRIFVYWNVLIQSWFMDIFVVGVPVVRGRRMVHNGTLLFEGNGVLKGNIVLKAKPVFVKVDPKRDCWRGGTHDLYWYPATA